MTAFLKCSLSDFPRKDVAWNKKDFETSGRRMELLLLFPLPSLSKTCASVYGCQGFWSLKKG